VIEALIILKHEQQLRVLELVFCPVEYASIQCLSNYTPIPSLNVQIQTRAASEPRDPAVGWGTTGSGHWPGPPDHLLRLCAGILVSVIIFIVCRITTQLSQWITTSANGADLGRYGGSLMRAGMLSSGDIITVTCAVMSSAIAASQVPEFVIKLCQLLLRSLSHILVTLFLAPSAPVILEPNHKLHFN